MGSELECTCSCALPASFLPSLLPFAVAADRGLGAGCGVHDAVALHVCLVGDGWRSGWPTRWRRCWEVNIWVFKQTNSA